MLKNSEDNYGLVSRAIHWLMALLIVVLFAVGLYMTGLEDDNASKGAIYDLHKSFGVVVLLGLIFRLVWLMITRPPALPRVFGAMEKALTLAVRHSLYLLMFIVPFSGYAMSNFGGHSVELFGLAMPTLFAESEAAGEFMEEVHEIGAWILIILAVVHMLGALKHRYFDLDPEADVLRRMWR